MKNIIISIIDFIFPPSKEVLVIRALSREDIFAKFPSAPPTLYPFISAIFAYKNPLVSTFVANIKYKKDKHSIHLAGFALYSTLKSLSISNAILLPIPITKRRKRERGYNQCELMIDEIMKLDKQNIFCKNYEILIREKNLESQTKKNRKERLEAKNIFKAIKIERLLDKNIIIIDDVTTTHNTAKEAWQTMKDAGYKNVSVLTLAH
ncbi:MAG TPA: hypothetical protein VJC02_00590 [Candidatus Paceibacterota bacterium]